MPSDDADDQPGEELAHRVSSCCRARQPPTISPPLGCSTWPVMYDRVVGGEEDVARRDLVGLERPPEEVCPPKLSTLSAGNEAGISGVQTGPGATRVDADPALLEVAGERAREGDDRALGGGVVDQVRAAAIGGDRGRVDDRGARSGRCGRQALVRWNMPKMLVRKVRSSCAAVMSSSRSCGCCSAALLTSTSRRPKVSTALPTASRQKLSSPMSPGDRDAAPARPPRPGRGSPRVVVLVEIEDRDVGALLGEADRDRAADAAVAAADQRDLAGELAGAAVVRISARGGGVICACTPGWRSCSWAGWGGMRLLRTAGGRRRLAVEPA